MNVLSLFDGMSCGRIALQRAGVTVDTYYASELDKFAIKVTQANWPETVQLGDVTKWREWDIDWSSIDLLIGGSPCQGFSFAGKQLAFDDPRSALFFVYVDILNHISEVNPNVKFLLENVKMKKEFIDVITEYVGEEPTLINSSLVSAQNRQRLYWSNMTIEQPQDRGVVLNDVLDTKVNIPNSEGWHRWFKEKKEFQLRKKYSVICNDGSTDKAICMTARQYASWNGNFAIVSRVNEDLLYRNLTPIECERLQTVPDNYTMDISNSQRYKMLGNGWTVDVIAHIFKGLL
tara:strand:+ start:32 stop:901 length:870 start_codon:yes stop_codon:yes gene_type:complete